MVPALHLTWPTAATLPCSSYLLTRHLRHAGPRCAAATDVPTASLEGRSLVIATRASALAVRQANMVADAIVSAGKRCGILLGSVQLLRMETRGDMPSAASGVGLLTMRELGPGAFTAELDAAVAGGRVDMAVHSLKDAPPLAPPDLQLACCLPREDPRDALVSLQGFQRLSDLPRGAVVGTSSSRRKAQILAANPGLRVVPMRGNVDARLERMRAGDVDATLLALAGLHRLGRADIPFVPLPAPEVLPAACQGIVGVMTRASDVNLASLLRAHACDAAALLEATVERAVVLQLMLPARSNMTPSELLMPDCAVAALAQYRRGEGLRVTAMVADPSGIWAHEVDSQESEIRAIHTDSDLHAALDAGAALGTRLGKQLRAICETRHAS